MKKQKGNMRGEGKGSNSRRPSAMLFLFLRLRAGLQSTHASFVNNGAKMPMNKLFPMMTSRSNGIVYHPQASKVAHAQTFCDYGRASILVNRDSGCTRRYNSNIAIETDKSSEREEDDIRVEGVTLSSSTLSKAQLTLPRHPHNADVNSVLKRTEDLLRSMSKSTAMEEEIERESLTAETSISPLEMENEETLGEKVFANSYVDLGKITTIGFDFDYTLVTYSTELLSLIYDMALERLVEEKQYPVEMIDALKGKFDEFFSIRGLAVDKDTGWICHLSYTHKVAVAWEGREKVSSDRLMEEYSGKRSLRPNERKKRLKPLNDLFSMAECCLIADTIQFFKDRSIPFFPRSCTEDILSAIGITHISGDFHRLVASNPEKYFEPKPHLASVLNSLKASGKKLIFVSNSPFWYVQAGMNHVMGPDWRETWDAVIVSAGKPSFYTDKARPFREVSTNTGRIKFKKVDRLEPGEVYTQGCLRELIKCGDWNTQGVSPANELQSQTNAGYAGYSLASPSVLYVGDSLFADLVDAKREFGWTTAAVTPEVGYELELQSKAKYVLTQQIIDLLTQTLRQVQYFFGNQQRTADDTKLMNQLEEIVSIWRDEQTEMSGNAFGSVFRARFQPSLFAHSLRRYCDLYMSGVDSLRHYSPQHRFYPEDARLLGHEIKRSRPECWDFDDI